MDKNITISQTEYKKLLERAAGFDYAVQTLRETARDYAILKDEYDDLKDRFYKIEKSIIK